MNTVIFMLCYFICLCIISYFLIYFSYIFNIPKNNPLIRKRPITFGLTNAFVNILKNHDFNINLIDTKYNTNINYTISNYSKLNVSIFTISKKLDRENISLSNVINEDDHKNCTYICDYNNDKIHCKELDFFDKKYLNYFINL